MAGCCIAFGVHPVILAAQNVVFAPTTDDWRLAGPNAEGQNGSTLQPALPVVTPSREDEKPSPALKVRVFTSSDASHLIVPKRPYTRPMAHVVVMTLC